MVNLWKGWTTGITTAYPLSVVTGKSLPLAHHHRFMVDAEQEQSPNHHFSFGERCVLRMAKTKLPKDPEQFSFKILGMEVSGTGRFPVVCAVIFAAILTSVMVVQTVGLW
ncbi:hypothetical protein BLJAPNOD_01273 [Ensifer sp. M14]|uniref:hypothetical protein n=1 Tax=Ensifer sp. M14 TaxID=2203782 RepID=UPI000E1C85C5|nr:hypothetical protein [Ensifer sp. M14]RDL50155.1 hypothetical protein BLJAPNOD_01273 [Ensifer sp. M14]